MASIVNPDTEQNMGYQDIFRLIDSITGLNDKPMLLLFFVSIGALAIAGHALYVVYSAAGVRK